MTAVRKGQGSVQLDRDTFRRRFEARFVDPAFEKLRDEVGRLADAAWEAYEAHRKAPHTRAAGDELEVGDRLGVPIPLEPLRFCDQTAFCVGMAPARPKRRLLAVVQRKR
jgi:hypothetical protein